MTNGTKAAYYQLLSPTDGQGYIQRWEGDSDDTDVADEGSWI